MPDIIANEKHNKARQNMSVSDGIHCTYVQMIHFLPEASFGLRALSLPACVSVSVNHELVCAITHHEFELEYQIWTKTAKHFA